MYSCIIEFIKKEEMRSNARLSKHLSLFRIKFNKFNDT